MHGSMLMHISPHSVHAYSRCLALRLVSSAHTPPTPHCLQFTRTDLLLSRLDFERLSMSVPVEAALQSRVVAPT